MVVFGIHTLVSTVNASRNCVLRFWEEKRSRTVNPDTLVAATLEALGWSIIVVWECELFTNEEWLGPLCQSMGPTFITPVKGVDSGHEARRARSVSV